jgi:hypothetical protein
VLKMNLPSHLERKIALEFYLIDVKTRRELIEGYIVSENDYTSTLASNLRNSDFLGGNISHIFSRRTEYSEERNLGCDGLVVVRVEDEYKVGFFEAKWPQLNRSPNQNWDGKRNPTFPQLHQNNKISRFDDQLYRQMIRLHSPKIIVWEMFYMEMPFMQPNNLNNDDFGTTCITFGGISNHFPSRSHNQLWSDSELKNILNNNTTTNLYEIMHQMLSCDLGEEVSSSQSGQISIDIDLPLEIQDFEISDEIQSINIPFPLEGKARQESFNAIHEFMDDEMIDIYSFFDFTEFVQ